MLADASENMAGADNPWAVDEVGAENLRGCASAWENPPASKSTSEEAAPPSKRLRGDNGMPVVERGQILRGGEYVQNINGPKGLSHDNTFCLGATAMDTMFIPAEDGSVQGDMRGRLVEELLTQLVVEPAQGEFTGSLADMERYKYYRVPLDPSNMELLRARAATDPLGPFARLLEVDEAVDAVVHRSGSKTDFWWRRSR